MQSLTGTEIYLLLVLGGALVLFVTNRLPPDLVALLALLAVGLGRLVTPEQALAGFGRPAVITIIGLFIITAALEHTGVIAWLADQLAQLSGATEPRVVLVFMLAGAVLSLVMNNIAAGAVLLPAAVRVARSAQIPPSKVLIPLAYGTLLGGMATLFTTANIILSAAVQAAGQPPLTLGDFLRTGGPILIAGTIFMLVIGRRLLPRRESLTRMATNTDLRSTYQLDERLWEVTIAPTSPLVGQTVRESRIGERLGVTVMGIWHGREAKIPVAPHDRLFAEDILLLLGREERVRRLEAERAFIGRIPGTDGPLRRQAVELTEVIIAPRSPTIGQTLKDLHFRDKYGLTTVAIWRNGRSHRTDVGTMPLESGDALLMVGSPQRTELLAQEPGYIVLEGPRAPATMQPGRGPLSALIVIITILVSALGWVSTPEAMLAGAVTLVLSGSISMEQAYRAIDWRIIFLIAGMVPLSTAMVNTGLATELGQLFVSAVAPLGSLALVAGLYLGAMLLTQAIGGQVTALIIGPIALTAATQAGISQSAMAVAVAIGCSTAFLTPIAHPVNLLVISPGGYSYSDFFKVGSGLTLVCFVVLMAMMVFVWHV